MRKLRGLIVAGGMNYDIFLVCLKDLQRPFESACMDLRSQVVREACITLAYLSQQIKNKFASFGETVLPTLLNLIQNSAKVSATATKTNCFSYDLFFLTVRHFVTRYQFLDKLKSPALAVCPISLMSPVFLSSFLFLNKGRRNSRCSSGTLYTAKHPQ